ncbi:MAG: NifB/NifX family molybdenum-iron cluster-binding protein [Desulfatirhabdiaceae bacterium]
MKAAFAVWNKRIAPVFDVAREIRLIETEFGHVVCERDESLPVDSGPEKGRRLIELGIETLICGAISRFMLSLVEAYGIQVISFVAGDLKEIIQAWLSNDFHREAFAMPGCGRRNHRLSRTAQLNTTDSRTPKQHRDCMNLHDRKGFGQPCSVRETKEHIMEKVAISCEEPGLDSQIDPRFGRAAGFCIVDPETLEFSYIDNGSSQALSQGAGIQAAETVCRSGATVVLTGYVGPKAFQALSAAGIKIGQNLMDMTVRQAIDKYKAGTVDMAAAPNRMGHGK